MKGSPKLIIPLVLGSLFVMGTMANAAPRSEQVADTSFTRSISASVTCQFTGPGRRGLCSAQPRGTGYTYTFYTSGPISVATGPATSPVRSATCGGVGSVTVVVNDGAGNTGSASTSTTCGSSN